MKKRSVISVTILVVLVVPLFAQTPNDFKIDLSRSGDAITITGYIVALIEKKVEDET